MLPSSYQACLQAQLSSIQFLSLQIWVALLQQERCVSIERLATLFAQPIQFDDLGNAPLLFQPRFDVVFSAVAARFHPKLTQPSLILEYYLTE